MCNGDSTRTSQGGTIAVLSSPLSSPRASNINPLEGELFFQYNSVSQGSGTTASLRSRHPQGLPNNPAYHVVIHEKGDMSIPYSQAGLLHRFELAAQRGTGRADARAQWQLEQSLDLGVGGDGIIGRRISIFEDAGLERQVAEGVIGWN